MLAWLRRILTDTEALERRLGSELQATKEDLSRRISVIEQRLDESELVLRRLGHQVARIEGRTSLPRPSVSDPIEGASADRKEPEA